MNGLNGKVAIVTGGASGIGAAACRRFVQEGARVAIGDIDGDRAHALAKELGTDAIGVRFDAGDVAQVEDLVSKTMATFGRLDFLFNNAAIMTHDIVIKDTNPVDIDFATWDLVQRVNVRGYLAGCKFAIPHMLKTGGGSIVMTASGSGIRGDISNIAYGCSKAAIICMAMYVATQYGKQGIRCNAINPGLIRTEGGKKNVHGPILDIITRNHLTPYVGQPEDIAAMAVYLCSDDGRFITGQAVNVDGGINAHMPYYAEMQNLNVKWDIPLTPGAESAA